MANISRDTFDKLKHYVGVRLQQGVPLVDADWNEQEDIRKYELRTFLKWFVGDGVPKGNDGFRIESIEDKIILSLKKNVGQLALRIDVDNSTAHEILGFDKSNAQAIRAIPIGDITQYLPTAQLTGKNKGPFQFTKEKKTLIISIDGLLEETITFQEQEISADKVVDIIKEKSINQYINASVGDVLDFDIKGGDGTPEGAGRCLVEGWDVINECNLKYISQHLYQNKNLADTWNVEPLKALSPIEDQTDTVYLDVWEREVVPEEDNNLKNEAIGIETCVRMKREWVVRVQEGADKPPEPLGKYKDHVFYPLAHLKWKKEVDPAGNEKWAAEITDLRLTGLSMVSVANYNNFQQIIKDAFGQNRNGELYTLDDDGQANLNVSLRKSINALLRGDLSYTSEQKLLSDTESITGSIPFSLEVKKGEIWLLWHSYMQFNPTIAHIT